MTTEKTSNEANANVALVTQRLQQNLNDIRKVLEQDLRAFPEREAKRRFLENGTFSEEMDDSTLSAFKEDVSALSGGVAASAIEALSEDSPWLDMRGDLPETDQRSLEWNPVVFQHLQSVAGGVQQVLEKHGFPAELSSVEYKTPTWFIDGLYLPGLIENYWKGLTELRAAQVQVDEVQRVESVQNLADRWEDA
jgi:hypothetical protein